MEVHALPFTVAPRWPIGPLIGAQRHLDGAVILHPSSTGAAFEHHERVRYCHNPHPNAFGYVWYAERGWFETIEWVKTLDDGSIDSHGATFMHPDLVTLLVHCVGVVTP